MSETILCDDTRLIWNKVFKVSGGKKSNTVDCEIDAKNISEAFVYYYKSFYYSVSYDKHDVDHLLLKLNELIEFSNAINMLN